MFRKQDFKKIDLLGSGKKNTKIYKVEHLPSGKIYALKEIEAKNLDKLNEYKEEAVQLSKAQNHANIVHFYGYYFYETMYNTYRVGLVTEFMDHRSNLEYVFRKRKQQGVYWKEREIEKMMVSFISTMSYLQSIGICHRDVKPANLFLVPAQSGAYHIKVIDFGESKDYFHDDEGGGAGTMATIRGTPQYLSPILWKAHVVDGNSRHATHNIFKSDVFSSGLVFYQLAAMQDVTGFNQKNHVNDGEKLISQGLTSLRKRYSEHIVEILRLMLKFQERERPSFIELAKLVLTTDDIDSHAPQQPIMHHMDERGHGRAGKEEFKSTPAATSSPEKKEESKRENQMKNKSPRPQQNPGLINKKQLSQIDGRQEPQPVLFDELSSPKTNQDLAGSGPAILKRNMTSTVTQLLTQAELFRNYIEENKLFMNNAKNAYWFQFGGNRIGRIQIEEPPMQSPKSPMSSTAGLHHNQAQKQPTGKWKLTARYRSDFPPYFTIVYVDETSYGTYLLGGGCTSESGPTYSCMQFLNKTLTYKKPMPQDKSFFPAIQLNGIIYSFGGYDATQKQQLNTCESYNIVKDEWSVNPSFKLKQARSQSSACFLNEYILYIFGGYHKETGTLDTIEKGSLKEMSITMVQITMPSPLRRFASIKISQGKILLMGGLSRLSKQSDSVYCFDLEGHKPQIEKLDKIERGGAIDFPIMSDAIGNLHLFVENCSGTSPPFHQIYSFLEYS